MNIIIMHFVYLNLNGSRVEDFLRFYTCSLYGLYDLNPDPGDMNFTIFVEDMMNIIPMHFFPTCVEEEKILKPWPFSFIFGPANKPLPSSIC